MSYDSIATLLRDPKSDMALLRYAIDAAAKWGAHLHVLCAGVNLNDPGFYHSGAQPHVVEKNLDDAREKALALRSEAKRMLEGETISWEVEPVVMMSAAIASYVSGHMRYFDLVILPAPYGEGRHKVDVNIFEACLFGAHTPVLVAPSLDTPGASMAPVPYKPMVAWDGSAEALAAARAIKPLLKVGATAGICMIDPPDNVPERSDPGGRLAQYLKHSGAKVHISVLSRANNDTATQLTNHAKANGADVLVMGGYGHSRLREAVIGGVTRSMLQGTDLPILMAH